MRVAVSIVFRVPPVSWIVSVWKWSSPKPYFVLQPADLHHLAAEPDEDRGGDVRMRGVAPEHALQRLEALAGIGHAAAGAVRQRDDAVDVRIGGRACRNG